METVTGRIAAYNATTPRGQMSRAWVCHNFPPYLDCGGWGGYNSFERQLFNDPGGDTRPTVFPTGPAIQPTRPGPTMPILKETPVMSVLGSRLSPTLFNPGGVSPLGGNGPLNPGFIPQQPQSPFNPGPIIGGLAGQGCEKLPQFLQAACKAAASQFVPGGQQSPVPGIPSTDPTPGSVTPGEASMGQTGMMAPMMVQRNRLECPKVPGQKRGIVHYSPQTGQYICLPAGTNGAPFGLVRKNKKRAPAYVSAADIKRLRSMAAVQKKAKAFGKLAGVSCKTKR